MSSGPIFRRILLKLSGEVLGGAQGYGVDPNRAAEIAREIADLHALGVLTAIVMGGAIFFAAWRNPPRKWIV